MLKAKKMQTKPIKTDVSKIKVEPKKTKVEPKKTKIESKKAVIEPKKVKIEPKKAKIEPKKTTSKVITVESATKTIPTPIFEDVELKPMELDFDTIDETPTRTATSKFNPDKASFYTSIMRSRLLTDKHTKSTGSTAKKSDSSSPSPKKDRSSAIIKLQIVTNIIVAIYAIAKTAQYIIAFIS